MYGLCLRSGGPGADRGVGVSFMQKLAGVSWRAGEMSMGAAQPDDPEVKRKEERLLGQLAEIPPSLPQGRIAVVRPRCCPGWAESSHSSVGTGKRSVGDAGAGPFDTAAEYYTTWAEQYLELIADGQVYAAYPVNAYLTFRFLKDNISQLVQPEEDDEGGGGGTGQGAVLPQARRRLGPAPSHRRTTTSRAS